MRGKMRRKGVVLGMLVIFTFLVVIATGITANGQQRKLEEIEYRVGWLVSGGNAYLFVALEKGYLAEEGLSVKISRGYGAVKNLLAVDAGQLMVSEGDTQQVIMYRAKGAKVKSIAARVDKSPIGYVSLKQKGITKPKDMEGRRLGESAASGARVLLPVFAKINGIDLSKVKEVNIDAGVYEAAMFAGRVDIVGAYYANNYPVLFLEAKKRGLEIDYIRWADWGMDIYSLATIASDKVIGEKPDMLRRLLRATIRGYEYAVQRADETVDIILKYHPELPRDITRLQWLNQVELGQTKTWKEKGIGWMSEEKVRLTKDIVSKALGIEKETPLGDIYTNEFLPKK